MSEKKINITVTPSSRPSFWGDRVATKKLRAEIERNEKILKEQQERMMKKWEEEKGDA